MTDEDTRPVSPEKWENMTINELFAEKTILIDRYYYALGTSAPYAKAIADGIVKIDTLIEKIMQS